MANGNHRQDYGLCSRRARETLRQWDFSYYLDSSRLDSLFHIEKYVLSTKERNALRREIVRFQSIIRNDKCPRAHLKLYIKHVANLKDLLLRDLNYRRTGYRYDIIQSGTQVYF